MEYMHKELTEKIIGCCFQVYNELGTGFLESVYENSLIFELKKIGLTIEHQKPLNVFYKGELVGEFKADLVVAGTIIVELKAISNLNKIHEVQLVNYLKATGLNVGLLINFGEKLEFKRKING